MLSGLGMALMLAFALPPRALAVEEGRRPLWTACTEGSAAGRCVIPRGVAADPTTGHIYVVNQSNARIEEFTAWGNFVKAWGGGVANGVTPVLQTCTTTCFPGLEGSGPGQFKGPQGIAIDSAGNIYVTDRNNARVQKFTPAGEFLLMFGGGVNQGPLHPGDVCTAIHIAEGDTCGAGSKGSGPGEFAEIPVGDSLAIDSADTVYVGDQNRVQRFNSSGVFQSEFSLPEPGLPKSLEVDNSGGLYLAYSQDYGQTLPQQPDVYRLNAVSGAVLGKLAVEFPLAIAVDPDDNVYVAHEVHAPPGDPGPIRRSEVFVYSAAGALTHKFAQNEGFGFPSGIAVNVVTAAGEVGAYVANSVFGKSFVRAYYPPPDLWPPPPEPPEIEDQYAVSVGSDRAVVRAEINPNFWDDTRYYVEYGTADCESNPCATQPTPPGSPLGGGIVEDAVATAGIPLSGLAPGTTYHYRFVAQSGGGGPVKGVGGVVGASGASGVFRTRPLTSAADTGCPNQAFRGGASGRLPDCRAYEMVTPVDKNDSDVVVTFNNNNNFASLNQAAVGGGALTYSSYRAFGDAQSAPYVSQYIARRDAANGWVNHGITPPRSGPSVYLGGEAAGLDVQFKAFSPDLGDGWILYDGNLTLAPGAVPGYGNLYRRDNLGETYEAITRVSPPHLAAKDFIPEIQGVSADGRHVIFTASDNLTPNAPATGIRQLYDFHDGELDLVSILPGEVPSTTNSTAGTVNNQLLEGRNNSVARAISDDGSRIFWSTFAGNAGAGSLHVRIDGSETFTVSPTAAQFWTAARDGSKAVFTNGGTLRVFDTDAKTTTTAATGVLGVLGASDDVSRIYFVSTESLAGGAAAGEPNLYLHEEGAPPVFVAELSTADATASTPQGVPSPINLFPIKHSATVSPDGLRVAFMSTASLTGYDNRDVESGAAVAEVYLYDADGDDLRCVSCNHTGARPASRDVARGTNVFLAAGRIPGWSSQLYAPRVLAPGGGRLFFESVDPLSPHDANGMFDVYQWELPGVGSCEETDSSFDPDAGGCVSLISSGESRTDSQFVDASVDGDDVFIATASRLVPDDPGLIDVYDARIGGGFAPSPLAAAPCEGEACQAPAAPPVAPAPASSTFDGPGDPPPAKHKKKKQKKKKKSKKKAKKKAKGDKQDRHVKRGKG